MSACSTLSAITPSRMRISRCSISAVILSFEASADDFYISLTSTNDLADSINEQRLAQLPGKIWKAAGNNRWRFRQGISADGGRAETEKRRADYDAQ